MVNQSRRVESVGCEHTPTGDIYNSFSWSITEETCPPQKILDIVLCDMPSTKLIYTKLDIFCTFAKSLPPPLSSCVATTRKYNSKKSQYHGVLCDTCNLFHRRQRMHGAWRFIKYNHST